MVSSQPSRASIFAFYVALILVTGTSVVFGVDWLSAPLPPMHETEASVQAAKAAAKFPPPETRIAKVEAKPRVVVPMVVTPQGRAVAAVDASGKPAVNIATPSIMKPENAAQETQQSAQPKCDVEACRAAYRSFRESDCSWQPYNGPRQFCDRGTPPQDVASSGTDAASDPDQQVSNKCDQEACKRSYFTFDPTDCTYQPTNGPRRLCTRGTPPKDVAAADPNAKPDADQQVSNKCDQDACKRAYQTFNPADCTYKPTLYGPRELCARGTPPKPDAAGTDNKDTKPADTAAADKPKSEKSDGDADAPNAPKCNIDACKAAFISFTPEDCTYQPIDGPRRLCTK